MVGEAPLGQDRAAARDDAGHALGGHRDVAQQHAGVDGEVVHALLGLLDQRVAEDLPGEVLGLAVDLLQRLVDRHGADRHRAVAHDPLARLVDVLAGGQIHHRVAAPADRPGHLLDFLLDAGAERRVADVGVDLDEEVAADDHRLGFRVVDVGGDDGAAARHFVAHELGRDDLRDRRAEGFAGMLALQQFAQALALLVFADGDELHLRRDDAAAGVVHLRDIHAGPGAARPALQVEAHFRQLRIGLAFAAVGGAERRQLLAVAALLDPLLAQRGESLADVDLRRRVGVGAGAVVDADRRVLFRPHACRRVGLADLAHRHADVGPAARDVDLARMRQGLDSGFVHMGGRSDEFI